MLPCGRVPVERDPAPPDASIGDEKLIGRVRAGDHAAYAELVRRYSSIAHRTATLIVGPADAEDVVQDAFVRAFYGLDQFRIESPFKPWLLTIVANAARNRLRTSARQPRLRDRLARDRSVGLLHLVPSAEAIALSTDERRDLVAAIDALPTPARLVVTCRYLLELSEAETAQILGWPVGTVKSRLSRALQTLRAALARDGGAR